MRNRRLLIIIILLVLLVAIVIFVISKSGGRGDSFVAACDKFIGYVIKKDSNASYNMFTEATKGSKEDWDIQVVNLYGVYNLGTTEMVSDSNLTEPSQAGDGKIETSGPERRQIAYTLTNPVAISDVTCTVTQDGSAHKIEGFTSGVRPGSVQQ